MYLNQSVKSQHMSHFRRSKTVVGFLTRSTPGFDVVGLPFGQVRAAASVAGLMVYGASPGKTKLGVLLVRTGDANEWTLKINNSKLMRDIMKNRE